MSRGLRRWWSSRGQDQDLAVPSTRASIIADRSQRQRGLIETDSGTENITYMFESYAKQKIKRHMQEVSSN